MSADDWKTYTLTEAQLNAIKKAGMVLDKFHNATRAMDMPPPEETFYASCVLADVICQCEHGKSLAEWINEPFEKGNEND